MTVPGTPAAHATRASRFARVAATGSVPAWFAPATIVLAATAGLALPGRPAGLGLALVGAGVCCTVAAAAASRDPFAIGCWLAAAALACVPAVRAAGWVVALSLVAALALAAVAAGGGRTWRELGGGLLATAGALVPGPFAVLALLGRRLGSRTWRWLGPVARGAVLAALLLAVFVPLLVAADAAFADLLDDLWSWDPGLDRPLARAGAALLTLALGGALLLAALHRGERSPRPAARRLGRTEWAMALGALDLVFAAFVAVQAATLFGGHDHVLDTPGLTYAEYARSGFFQLEVAAALTLAVVAAAARWAGRDRPADDRLARALLGVLCAFALLLLAGAVRRWARLPRAIVAMSAVAALGFAASDPDARIAERNVERYAKTGRLDVSYLRGLSADAAPAIARLPRDVAACASEPLRYELGMDDGFAGASWGRARARAALAPLDGVHCEPR